MIALGGVLMLAGIGVLVVSRRADKPLAVALPGIGPMSLATQTVVGLALLGVGYHLLVYELNWAHFRAPLPVALSVAVAVVAMSLLNDAIENRAN